MASTEIVVASFWVHRPKDFPKAADYGAMLKVLQGCCDRFGYRHVVLTDLRQAPAIHDLGIETYAIDLPRNLMKAVTEVQARWLESPYSMGVDTLFTGADCLIRRDFRGAIELDALTIAFMKDHKKWRLNTGFMYVPAGLRSLATPLFRLVADDCTEIMCDDMAALERALAPMPKDYATIERRGMKINLVPMRQWNATLDSVDDEAADSYVLHFLGEQRKPLFFAWAKRWGFA